MLNTTLTKMKAFSILSLFITISLSSADSLDSAEIYARPQDWQKLGIETYLHPDANLNVKEIIQKYEYPLEVHDVQTEDGYILEVHRIPHGKNQDNPDPNRPVVLLMHGLLCSSADWVITGTDKGLAFILADLGYDVWLGNARGNTWSKRHIKYNPDKSRSKFWNFSWHEIGVYDLPAMIDHINGQTAQEKIFYIGHSQATTAFYVMTSEKPEYNDKIRLMVSLAPIAYMGNIPNIFFRIIAKFEGTLGVLSKLLGMNEFLPSTKLMADIGKSLCEENAPFKEVCNNVLFLICGFNAKELNATVLPVIITHTPAGAATKQLLHFGQQVNSGKFRKYDYGLGNLIKYKSLFPPKYKLQNVKAPVAFFYGSNDLLAAVEDVNKLAGELPNLVHKYLIEDKKFNHLDFLWSNNVVSVLYEKVLKVMNNY